MGGSSITINDDAEVEEDETFRLIVQSSPNPDPNADVLAETTFTIRDNDNATGEWTEGDDTNNVGYLLESVDGLGGTDTLIVDYSLPHPTGLIPTRGVLIQISNPAHSDHVVRSATMVLPTNSTSPASSAWRPPEARSTMTCAAVP